MRRFLISSPKFEGEVDVIYNTDGRMLKLDFTGAKLSMPQTDLFKRQVPAAEAELSNAFSDPSTTIVEAEFEISLEDFKREYPYHRNMHLVPDAWKRMSKTDQVLAFTAVPEYRKYCERNEAWYKPKICVAWLKNKEYLNDWKKM